MNHRLPRCLPALVLIAASIPGTAAAQEWRINIDEDKARAAGLDPDELESSLQGGFGDSLKVDGQEEFLTQMAAASVLAVKGMGVDYATNPQRFVLGGAIGTAASGSGFTFTRGDAPLPTGGFAFQASAMAGLNLGVLSKESSALRRVMVYGNGLVAKTTPEPFEASTYHFGAHVQIKLIRLSPETADEVPMNAIEWGGIDLTGGFEYTSSSLSLIAGLPLEFDAVRWDSTGSYTVITDATSIPIELSTNLRVFVLTAFFGGGVDITQDALATSDISLAGPIRYTAGEEQDLGSITFRYQEEGGAAAITGRGFGGFQLNILMVKAYAQLNIGIGNESESVGGHIGARVSL